MTTETNDTLERYTISGSGPYAFSFRIFDETDLSVTALESGELDPVAFTYGVHYSVASVNDEDGGSITLLGTTATTYASYTLDIRSNVPREQPTSIKNQGSFAPQVHETAFDRLSRQIQDLYRQVRQSFRYPDNVDLDAKMTDRASWAERYLYVNASGVIEAAVGMTNALTQSIFNAFYFLTDDHKRTQAEIDAGVTPVNYAFKEGWAKRYGAALDGVTDDTAALLACFDFCIGAGIEAVLDGDALVTGAITSSSSIASGSLYIRCVENVTITVDASSTAFNTLIKCHTAAINSSVIRGGRLTLALNNKCANGIYLRHGGSDGGTVDWGPVTVTDAKNNDNTDVNENQAVLIYGRYKHVNIDNTRVEGVDRTNTSGGACKGISISEIVGNVNIVRPYVRRVLCTGSSADADGISVFARQGSGVYSWRAGSLTMTSPHVEDCEGRSIKTQMSESVIINPVIRRKSVVAFVAPDIDYQIGGNHSLIEPSFEYLKDSGVTPFASGFFPIGFQQQCTDRPNRFRISGGSLRTEDALNHLVFLSVGASSLSGELSVDDFEVQNVTLTTTTFLLSVVGLDAGQVQAATKTHVSIRGVRGNFSDCALLGYNNASAANTSKLSFELIDNENTGADHADSDCFANLSGATNITQVAGFNIRDNSGFLDYLGTWVFNAMQLKVGCRFVYDRATSTVTNGPTISAGSYVTVECLGSFALNARNVRMTVDDANAANTVFYSQTGTWGTIK